MTKSVPGTINDPMESSKHAANKVMEADGLLAFKAPGDVLYASHLTEYIYNCLLYINRMGYASNDYGVFQLNEKGITARGQAMVKAEDKRRERNEKPAKPVDIHGLLSEECEGILDSLEEIISKARAGLVQRKTYGTLTKWAADQANAINQAGHAMACIAAISSIKGAN
jgi:hypothetical protein